MPFLPPEAGPSVSLAPFLMAPFPCVPTYLSCGSQQDVGPLTWLLRYGANVVAIDEPGCYATPQKPTIWRRLVAAARSSRGQV